MEKTALLSLSFCRVTQLGFLRLATDPKAFPTDAVPMNEAWRLFDMLLSDERLAFTDEPSGLESELRGFTQLCTHLTNICTDAHLAVLAKRVDYELVTFHKGFVQFLELRLAVLS